VAVDRSLSSNARVVGFAFAPGLHVSDVYKDLNATYTEGEVLSLVKSIQHHNIAGAYKVRLSSFTRRDIAGDGAGVGQVSTSQQVKNGENMVVKSERMAYKDMARKHVHLNISTVNLTGATTRWDCLEREIRDINHQNLGTDGSICLCGRCLRHSIRTFSVSERSFGECDSSFR
jgi:hypothetical protein